MSDKINFGVIGVGLQGKEHAKAYSEFENTNLLAVADLNRKKAEKIADELGASEVYTDFKDMLECSKLQGVSVTTPDHLHRTPVVESLKRGKHVLCEKPLATEMEDANAMLEVWDDKDVKFMVSFENRWNPPFRKAKRLIEKGEIGEITQISGELSARKSVPTDMLSWSDNTSPVFFLSSHLIDLCRWFTGSNVSKVYSKGCSKVLKVEGTDSLDGHQSILELENNVTCNIQSNWILPETYPSTVNFKFSIIGTEGRIDLDPTKQSSKLTNEENHKFPWTLRSMKIDNKLFGFVPGVVNHFVQCIKNEKDPDITPFDGKKVTETSLAIHKSIQRQKVIRE